MCTSVESLGSAPSLKILGTIKATKLASKLSWQWVFYLSKTEGNHGSLHCQELSVLGPGVSAVQVPRDVQGIIRVCLNIKDQCDSEWVLVPVGAA